jgi:hypothetical protein
MFNPELTLGAGSLSNDRRLELERFLVDVVRQRGCPLHLANLWNALYFHYDLDGGGFRSELLNPERIPTREAAERAPSLPVGGFVRVHTEMACGDLLGEVVHKEGAHPFVDSGFVEPSLSGAPADDEDSIAVVRERFVLDLGAFGKNGNTITSKQYERLCRRSRWLDSNGHLVIDAEYTPEEAALEDIDFYVEYLLREHYDGLLAFCFSTEPTEEELREALLRSFESVRAIALRADELCSWRDKYFFDDAGYRARVANGGVLGGGDLRTIYRGLTRVPPGSRRTYAAIGPRILDMLASDGFDPQEELMVRGCAYATAVCHANTYVSDSLRFEQRSGVLADGIHLRLDDDWQAGGIWRAEVVRDPRYYSLATVPPLIPLGLGYAETRKDLPPAETLAAEEQPISSSQTGFTVVLTIRDRLLCRLRLPAKAVEALAQGELDVQLVHDNRRERVSKMKRAGDAVYGVEWPWSCHPGIVLRCNIERGGAVIRARTTELEVPVVASDGTELWFETNLAVYERSVVKTLTAQEKRGAPTLNELVNRAFRRYGRERDDGARGLTIAELATAVLGPHWRPGESKVLAAALAQMQLERDGVDYLWRPRVSRYTRVADRSLLTAYGDGRPTGRLARIVHRHWVPMHLRLLANWMYGASPEKRRTYALARLEYGMYGLLPEELPPGYTWVEPHARGGEPEEPEGAQLELAD